METPTVKPRTGVEAPERPITAAHPVSAADAVTDRSDRCHRSCGDTITYAISRYSRYSRQMITSSPTTRRSEPLGAPRRRRRRAQRLLAGPVLGLSLTAALLFAPALAAADTSSTLTVVGTSDVSDSGLMPNVIQPAFQAAYPQFTFKYVGTATGTAISNAESGAGGPSVLIVHAASLENQFVAGGFSYEPYGRAIFTNDFVLAGPTGQDPAGVAANASHNIVQAFADVATAGAAGTAAFVSRSGSPGTVVAEHQIWALLGTTANPPAGLLLCTVSAANGGGETPVAAGVVASQGAACPGGLPPQASLPSWYKQTGLTQGPNVINANVCNYPPLGAGSCYVFTDRGTYDFLASGTDPAGSIPNLTILTRDNSAAALGGAGLLVNYFHAYVINPAAFTSSPNVQINVPAAEDFVNLLTSPSLQSQLKSYLGATNDPPFVADASPIITASGIPGVVNAGTGVTVTGNVTNAEPFVPALAGVPVTVSELAGGLPVPVGSATTDANGNYSVGFVPTTNGSYQVSTGQISQIENPTLSPPFGDLLQPSASAAAALNVQSAVSISSANPASGGAVVSGSVAPGAPHAHATVAIAARAQGATGGFTQVGQTALGASQSTYAVTATLQPGKYQLEAIFADSGQVLPSTSGAVNVTVAAAPVKTVASSIGFTKRTVKSGALTTTGTFTPSPTAKGSLVELFGRRTKVLKSGKKVTVSLKRLVKLSIAPRTSRFTIHAKLTRGYAWQLQLEYHQPGHRAVFSKLSSINVH
jgi:tungstate transport system substrate-binding protein